MNGVRSRASCRSTGRPHDSQAPCQALLAWQHLREAMRPVAIGRHAPIQLTTVTRLAVVAVAASA